MQRSLLLESTLILCTALITPLLKADFTPNTFTEQYRMHPNISSVVNASFHENLMNYSSLTGRTNAQNYRTFAWFHGIPEFLCTLIYWIFGKAIDDRRLLRQYLEWWWWERVRGLYWKSCIQSDSTWRPRKNLSIGIHYDPHEIVDMELSQNAMTISRSIAHDQGNIQQA